MKRVSLDIGGTFTDCLIVWDGQRVESKAPTTHHDLSQGFMDAFRTGAEQLGINTSTILNQVDSIRYGTTLGTNALIEQAGERVGLITTAGYEDTVWIGRGKQYGDGLPAAKQADIPAGDRPEPLVPRSHVEGLPERIDYKGDVLLEPRTSRIRETVNRLVDRGARAFAVVFLHSIKNPAHEQLVESVIQQEYPSHMLGSAPVVLSHRVTGKSGEYMRSNATIISAYLHRTLREGLKDLEAILRNHGSNTPLQLVHNTSGMARLGKTSAIQTMHAGPVAGLGAARQLSKETSVPNFITTDMGGTSLDIGVVEEGDVRSYDYEPVIDRWLINLPMVYMKSIGAGGGSILSFDEEERQINVGPDSAGSDPGPACYGQGGRKPTVTDVDLLLGYLNPDYFWGGNIQLREDLAERALRRNIADPMDVDVREAAAMARRVVDTKSAQTIFTEISLKGYDPRQFSLLSYGGAGPAHACRHADELGIPHVMLPPFSSIFSAAGGANLNQMHMHERSVFMNLYDGEGNYFQDYDRFNDIVRELKETGEADLIDEDFAADEVQHEVELDLRYGAQLQTTTARCPVESLRSNRDLLKVLKEFKESYGQSFGDIAHMPETGINLLTIRVRSYVDRPGIQFTAEGELPDPEELNPESPEPNHRRPCYFDGTFQDTPIYRDESLGETCFSGPAVVEHPETTIVIDSGWILYRTDNDATHLLKNSDQANIRSTSQGNIS